MKKIKYIYMTAALAAIFTSCSQEAPFSAQEENTGRILTSNLSVEVKSDEMLVRSESDLPSPKDFTIEFCKADNLNTSVKKYDTMKSMPEVVSLPVGDYVIKAYYGGVYGTNGEAAAFDKPYYYGVSNTISVEANKILDNFEPITCSLANVKVSVIFDSALANAMSADSKVSVKVGESGTLDFTKDTQNAGYFEFVNGSNSLVATFSGKVNGSSIIETKTYDNVKAGNYYKITFRLHVIDPNDPGNIVPGENGGLTIDATVSYFDHGDSSDKSDVTPDDNEYLEDDMRPENGSTNNGDKEPQEPENPLGAKPEIVGDGVNIDQVNEVTEDMTCRLLITSETSIKEFKVEITSTNPGFLSAVDELLGTKLDLVNEQPNWDDLRSLGLPTGKEVTNPETKDENGNDIVVFDVTSFMPILNGFPGTHTFNVMVTNSGGITAKALQLKVNE